MELPPLGLRIRGAPPPQNVNGNNAPPAAPPRLQLRLPGIAVPEEAPIVPPRLQLRPANAEEPAPPAVPNTGPLSAGEQIGPFHEGEVPYLTATYRISNASGATTKVRKVATRNHDDKFRETVKEIRIYKRLQGFRGWEDFILPYLAGETYHNGRKVYLNFRYLSGQDFVDYTNSKPGLGNIRKVVLDVAHALDFCLKAGISHGDIRPDNVYITMDGAEPHGRLFDFGLATVDPRYSDLRTDIRMFLLMITEDLKAYTLQELGANEGESADDFAERMITEVEEQKDIWKPFIARLSTLPPRPAGGHRRVRATRRHR